LEEGDRRPRSANLLHPGPRRLLSAAASCGNAEVTSACCAWMGVGWYYCVGCV
jgi:hypothetical protein